MAPLSCNPEDTNSWANTAQTLPTQPWSLVGLAARRLRRTPACPPRPLCLLDATRVVPDDGAGRYHRACEEEMAIVQEAHASVHRLTILPDDEDRLSVDRLCRAEEAELMAALGHYENGRGKPSGVRPPRAAALTVLVEPAYNTHEKKHAALVLDAAAFLAMSRERNFPMPIAEHGAEIDDWVGTAIESVLIGKIGAATALQTVDARVRRLLQP